MMSDNGATDKLDTRLDWVEPTMTELNVVETHRLPRFGRDNGPYADCQRS